MIHIGIDPGKHGAVAVHGGEGIIAVHDCPTIDTIVAGKRRVVSEPHMMADLLRPYAGGVARVTMEKVQAMPKQGATSMFSFGMNFGQWLGILAALKMPLTLVTPQKWKGAMMAGLNKASKGASRQRALQLFPDQVEQLRLVKHDGRAEAMLLAEYGRTQV